jgi:hypothetical protein
MSAKFKSSIIQSILIYVSDLITTAIRLAFFDITLLKILRRTMDNSPSIHNNQDSPWL